MIRGKRHVVPRDLQHETERSAVALVVRVPPQRALEQRHAQRPHVGGAAVIFVLHALGAHHQHGPLERVEHRARRAQLGDDAEVRDLRLSRAFDEDVSRFDVAVDQPASLVEVLETLGDAPGDSTRDGDGTGPPRLTRDSREPPSTYSSAIFIWFVSGE